MTWRAPDSMVDSSPPMSVLNIFACGCIAERACWLAAWPIELRPRVDSRGDWSRVVTVPRDVSHAMPNCCDGRECRAPKESPCRS